MPPLDDERERMLRLMFNRAFHRAYFGNNSTLWYNVFENENPAGTNPACVLPAFLTCDMIPGEPLPATPPVVTTSLIEYIDCIPLFRVTDEPITKPAYVLVDPSSPTQTEYGPRISVIPGCLIGQPAYEPQLKINPASGPTVPLAHGSDGQPLFDPLSGILTFESDPIGNFDPATDTIEITAWRYIGPTLTAKIASLGGGGPGGVLLTKCDRFLVTPVPGPGNPTNPFPLQAMTSGVTLDLSKTDQSLVFLNGNKLILGLDYQLQNNGTSGLGEIVFLNNTAEAGRYVVQDCDEAEAYVVTQ